MSKGTHGKKSRMHDKELASTSVSATKHNSGSTWIRSVIKTIWQFVHKMWTARNKDRHGHDEAERRERVRQRNLREISLWYECREDGKLEMSDAEALVFCDAFQEHSQREGTARLVDMWLATNRPVLQMCKRRATIRKGSDVAEAEASAAQTDEESAGTRPEDPDGVK